METTVGINGFGRVGRAAFRAATVNLSHEPPLPFARRMSGASSSSGAESTTSQIPRRSHTS